LGTENEPVADCLQVLINARRNHGKVCTFLTAQREGVWVEQQTTLPDLQSSGIRPADQVDQVRVLTQIVQLWRKPAFIRADDAPGCLSEPLVAKAS
jgi:hypothetical protein